MCDMHQINPVRRQWERNTSFKHYQTQYMEQKITQYEIKLNELRRACAMKDAMICTHEQEIHKQGRKIKYLQNIVKNMPVIAFPCLETVSNFYIDENPSTERKEKRETEDGWVLTDGREPEERE